jgi:glyoxylase-like metal-dependent hydrolase (beta-lactamase superfamily II)
MDASETESEGPAGGRSGGDGSPSGGSATGVCRIECSVDWPPGHVAAYLIPGPEPILVDAGMAGERSRGELVDGLADYGHDLDDVDHLVLTHPHVDHVGGVPALLDAGDPTVYAPAGVRERFARDAADLEARVRENATRAGLAGEDHDHAVERAVDSLRRNRELLPPAAVDRWIEGGEAVEIDDRALEAIHTPGHQADHCCFSTTVDGERALLAGDMVIAPFRAVLLHVGFDDGFERAIEASAGALDRLAGREIDRVYPGHGPVHGEFEGTVARDRERLERMVERTHELLSAGATTAAAVADERAGGGRGIDYLLPESLSALAHLEATSRATSTVDGEGVRRFEAW